MGSFLGWLNILENFENLLFGFEFAPYPMLHARYTNKNQTKIMNFYQP